MSQSSNPGPILHHYAGSLFSEKIRLLLGWKGIPWRSVEISPVMPRPLLMPLTGGYRRTPVLQIGADIYCDTRVICQQLELLQPRPVLWPSAQRFAADNLAEWADSHLFRVVVALCFQPEALAAQLGSLDQATMEGFAKDRAELAEGSPGIGRVDPAVADAWFRGHLQDLDAQVGSSAFLFGDSPCIADFSLYHCLWFIQQNRVTRTLLDGHQQVLAWMARMAKPGHGSVIRISAEDALAEAAATKPQVLPAGLADTPTAVPAGLKLGDQVGVAATDYGVKPILGELVGCTLQRCVIRRQDPDAGELLVHFPRMGFCIRPAG